MDRERFWSFVDKKEGGCWEWTRAKHEHGGHGRLRFGGRFTFAHRVAWMFERGPIPDGLCVCHHCDNPPCCNPDHLFLATNAENLADMRRKGRLTYARGSAMPTAKMDEAKVLEARICKAKGETTDSLWRRFGVNRSTMLRVLAGQDWKHVGGPLLTSRRR